jgi:hypothetical protein
MRPFEEYFNRHDIKDVPVVHHCNGASSLILKTTDSSLWTSRWLLVTLKWEPHDHRPGRYAITARQPVHDGYLTEQFFLDFPQTYKKWDEYEDFLLEWCNSLKGVVPVVGDHYEVVLTAWEMFVYVYDSWFLKQPNDIKNSLFHGLDKEKPIKYRYQHYQDVIVFLSTHQPAILRAWKYDFLVLVSNYADWLAIILNNKCKVPNTIPFKLEIP